MRTPPSPTFAIHPQPTTFIVNVIHARPGMQDDAFHLIQEIVRYVAERKPGFLWSSIARSLDGMTVVNIEAISDPGDVEVFFSDPVFATMFDRLDDVSTSEFHTYTVGDLVLPKVAS
ncbi:antibiotic biosynthesis monooxygenase [Azorhizobium oxalatiphilum]|uniref:Antibiotic biosynthesis monooxygenase n=1 Tax=Azorhizobium oxalatiphilum TaxID=980631 RepID=A0A917CDI5_9HYPH|nr:antibiotic biosynthesis monooxygenase [Azorhizobium oxalatiphilum]GGF84827.1 antibiotic biosynthesis monooxygenase [Azorhizobium oxalatiphilum]